MKLRCTICGASNESAPGFDTVYCQNCGSAFTVSDALDYRFGPDVRSILGEEGFLDLVKEALAAKHITPDVLELLHATAATGDVEVNYHLGSHYFTNRMYADAIPFLQIAAEKMYPDGQCLFAVSKYLLDPDDIQAYPLIRKCLATAKETCSKVYQKIDGDKLLAYIDAVLETKTKAQQNAPFLPFADIASEL